MATARFLGTDTDFQALALKMYMGSFVEPFRQGTLLWDSSLGIVERKMVDSGKSWQFLMEGDQPAPEEFTPGDDEMDGQAYAVHEETITVDKYLVASTKVSAEDMKISHFETLPRLAKKHARRMGREWDRRLFILNALNAREAAVTKDGLTIHSGGNRVTRDDESVAAAYATSSTGAGRVLDDLRQLARLMDEDNIPPDQRWIAYTPYIGQVLQYGGAEIFSRDYVTDNNLQQREVRVLEGFKVLGKANTTTNNGPFPDSDISTGPSKYRIDASIGASTGTPVIQAFCAGEAGQMPLAVLTFEGIKHFVEWQPTKLCWIVGSYILASGGQLHPYCSGSIEVIDTD